MSFFYPSLTVIRSESQPIQALVNSSVSCSSGHETPLDWFLSHVLLEFLVKHYIQYLNFSQYNSVCVSSGISIYISLFSLAQVFWSWVTLTWRSACLTSQAIVFLVTICDSSRWLVGSCCWFFVRLNDWFMLGRASKFPQKIWFLQDSKTFYCCLNYFFAFRWLRNSAGKCRDWVLHRFLKRCLRNVWGWEFPIAHFQNSKKFVFWKIWRCFYRFYFFSLPWLQFWVAKCRAKFQIPCWADAFEMFENFYFVLFLEKDQMFTKVFCFRISSHGGFLASSSLHLECFRSDRSSSYDRKLVWP